MTEVDQHTDSQPQGELGISLPLQNGALPVGQLGSHSWPDEIRVVDTANSDRLYSIRCVCVCTQI